MEAAIIHLCKHNKYYSANGVKQSGNKITVFLGYYNRNDLLEKMLSHSSFRTLDEGYRYPPTDDNVQVSYSAKISWDGSA